MSQIDSSPHSPLSTQLYRLASIALAVVLVGLVAVYCIEGWIASERQPAPEPATFTKTVGAQRYALPASVLSVPSQRANGFAERVDLAVALPLGPNAAPESLAVTVMPRGRLRTSARLLDSVYVHQFAADQQSGVPGLVGKPLRDTDGYTGETVWYDPLSPEPFVAKCMAPVAGVAPGQTCLRTLTLSDGNLAIMAFSPALLESWREIGPALDAWIARRRMD